MESDGGCDSKEVHDEAFWERFALVVKDDHKVNMWLDGLPPVDEGHLNHDQMMEGRRMSMIV